MKFQRQPVEEVNVNLTSLIDVVFLLLIFFMVSTTFTRERELTLELPQAEAAPAQAEQARQLEIEISAEGEIAVNGNLLVNRDPATLQAALKREAGDDRDLPVIITADANATHQAVMTVMDNCGQMGFAHLRISARKPGT